MLRTIQILQLEVILQTPPSIYLYFSNSKQTPTENNINNHKLIYLK